MTTSPKPSKRNKMIGYLTDALRGAATALEATQSLIGKEFGLSVEQWNALTVIGRTDRLISVSQLAWRLTHSRQSTYNLVIRLERLGWIRFWRNPDDRRLLQMEITSAGRIILNNANARRNVWLVTLTYDLADSELYVLMNRMRALQNRIARARRYT
jgi:DNA-binding MarR family transcriptional regulator